MIIALKNVMTEEIKPGAALANLRLKVDKNCKECGVLMQNVLSYKKFCCKKCRKRNNTRTLRIAKLNQ